MRFPGSSIVGATTMVQLEEDIAGARVERDLMLLQKLMLEKEPERFFRAANRRQADVTRAPNLDC